MLATLNGPIVTDFVPAAKPPWVLLAVFAVLVFLMNARETVWIGALALALVTLFILLSRRRQHLSD